jgi:hypothetical protein
LNRGEITKFLLSVWTKQCKPGEYVFLCTKNPQDKKSWRDHSLKYQDRGQLRTELRQFFSQYSPNSYDIYWCPLPFNKAKRDKNAVPRSKFLWQDLDYADPKKFDRKLFPTMYWESSPGRYHGLWEMDKIHKIEKVEALNRDLAYHVEADHGGWDLTQVLRIPGTKNHKYKNKPEVKLTHSHGEIYPFKKLRSMVKEAEIKKPLEVITSQLEEGDPKEILSRYSGKLPRDLLSTLTQREVPVGKRSEMLWHLENRLYECGMTPNEIFTVIKYSAWNKFRGRRDEDERLQSELSKIITDTVHKSQEEPKDLALNSNLKIQSYHEVMSSINTYPGWLVEGFWARRSHGIVAGEPKSFKSTFTMDLAVSVASGEPFLGKYPVVEPGPVVIIQNENTDWLMQDKIAKIIANRGLSGKVKKVNDRLYEIMFPRNIPLYMMNQQGYLLNNPEHQEALIKTIKELKPVLVIFDPLYLMFDGDVNSAKDLNPILQWLLKVKNELKTGVMLIHHYNKGGGSNTWRGGQRMLGSTTLHGWIESAWYLQVNQPEDGDDAEVDKVSNRPASVLLDREFRTAGHFPKIELKLIMGELGNPVYNVEADVYKDPEKVSSEGKRVTVESVAADIINVMQSRKPGLIKWDELGEYIGVKNRKMVSEGAALAAQTESELRVTKPGLRKSPEKQNSQK